MSQSYLGINISKSKFHVALQVAGKAKNQPKLKVFKNDASGFEQLERWLQQQGVETVHACLEATSTYTLSGNSLYLFEGLETPSQS